MALAALGLMGGVGAPAQAAEIKGEAKALNHISAEECKSCHKDIYEQWKGSMHANSTALNDPIHNAFYRQTVGDPLKEGELAGAKKNEDGTVTGGSYPSCLNCHAPNAAIDGKTKLDTMASYAEGVSCVVCHSLKSYKGINKPEGGLQLGIKAYEFSGDTLQGPGLPAAAAGKDAIEGLDGISNPHLEPVKGTYLPLDAKAVQFRTNDACMGCHDKRNNGHGVPLCSTGDEVTSKVQCQSCHMSVTNGKSDHTMGGGHNMGMLRRSMVLSVDAVPAGDTITTTVNMQNLQPHSMPTGAPFRNIFLKVSALDKDGKVVWESAKGHPMEDDPDAYLRLVLLDGDGKPTSPPMAKSRGADTRLQPFEKRALVYSIPAPGVASIKAELFYNLLWPNLQAAMKEKMPEKLHGPLLSPQSFMQAETKL
ncbi:MAG: cytochrome c family protein [Alphaproteobacteria bacterium]|nr:cytochrome c family protein [Alphaproteobacteria bacterium]